jgi:hypothetical protein
MPARQHKKIDAPDRVRRKEFIMLHFKRLFVFATAVSIGVMTSSSSLNAQAAAGPDTATVVIAVDSSVLVAGVDDAGPRVVRAGFVPASSTTALAQGSSGSQGLGAGSNVALMGVGAAGILVGSLVGGDGGTMISIGGGVIFFVGLFRWLR